jgi:putative flippase GtrA
MLKIILTKAWSHRAQFARYFIIGCSAFVLDIVTLFLLKELLHISAVVAVILNQALLLNYVFLLNKYWSFKGKGVTHKQVVRFYILAIANYAFSVVWIWIFTEHWHVVLLEPQKYNYLIWRTLNIMLAVGWNFLLYKFWVYADKQVPAESADVHNLEGASS